MTKLHETLETALDRDSAFAYVADWTTGVSVLDLGAPSSAALVGVYDSPDRSRDVSRAAVVGHESRRTFHQGDQLGDAGATG